LFFLFFAHSDNSEHFVLVKFFKSSGGDHFLVVLFGEQQTCLFESVTVETVCILEDLAYAINVDVLSEDVFALLLNGLDVISIGKLKKIKDYKKTK